MKGDLDKDGKMSGYEQARQDAIEKSMREQKQKGGSSGTSEPSIESTDERMTSFLRKYALTPHLMDVDFFKEPSFDKFVEATRAANEAGTPIPYVLPIASDSMKSLKAGYEEFMDDFEERRKPYRKQSRKNRQEGGPMSVDDQMVMVMGVKPMESDDDMEDNYTRFIMEEALTEEEEDMLTSKLEQDEELSMLFDKVIDVAQEFAGSGPVEGPGSGVSDSIPARLSDGEFVFTAKATEEIGASELMRMMKDAEASADKRQEMQTGGSVEEETMTTQTNEPNVQEIRVVKETVDSAGRMMEDEDEISKDIKSQMMLDPNQRHVRS